MIVCGRAGLIGLLLLWTLALFHSTSSNVQADIIKTFQVSSNANLTAVLGDIQQYLREGNGGYFRLQIANGTFRLTDATTLTTFVNLTEVSIVGESNTRMLACLGSEPGNPTVIDCEGTTGFAFVNVSHLSLANVTFNNCSSVQNSSSKNMSHSNGLTYVQFSAALYLVACSHLLVESITIANSYAVGLAMFNIEGSNTFSDCYVCSNFPPPGVNGEDGYGGGGVLLEFSYCMPGDLECGNTSVEVSNASFEFSNCHLGNNLAGLNGLGPAPIYPHATEHSGFGRGGGMAVYFKGKAINNSVTFSNCKITGNQAKSGGGLYVEFGDVSQDNNLTFTDIDGGNLINFNGQCCGEPSFSQTNREISGGGAKVVFAYYPSDADLWPGYQADVTGNRVVFRGTNISSNLACWGGGVSFVSSRADSSTPQTNLIHFQDCHFSQNKAIDSPALDISVFYPDPTTQGSLITPVIDGCFFSENSANARFKDSIPDLAGYQFGSGAVYIDTVPTTFTGVNNFTANIGTGLVMSDAVVVVGTNSSLLFDRNNGRRGGALVVMGSGSIIVYPEAVLNFTANEARERGGAIYVDSHFGERNFIYGDNCFIRYYQPTINPHYWKASFLFSNNTAAGTNNAIYITSLLACVWRERENTSDNIDQTLCWDGWVYDGQNATTMDKCSDYVNTSPASFNNSDHVYEMTAYPGHMTPIPVGMSNDYGEPVSPVVFAVTSNSTEAYVSSVSTYIADNQISVYGKTNRSEYREFFVETLGSRVLATTLKIKILPCPPGFTPTPAGGTTVKKCKCAFSLYFTCIGSEVTASINAGYCVRYETKYDPSCSNNSSNSTEHTTHNSSNSTEHSTHRPGMLVVKCLASAGANKPIPLPNDSCSLEKDFCGRFNRKGIYCSSCVEGYGVDINDLNKCVKCRYAKIGWLLYIVTSILPVTVFFIVVALFKISVTSAPMYAFVLFAQISTIRYFHNQFPWIFGLSQKHDSLKILLLYPYSMWNLDFFPHLSHFCVSHQLSDMYSLLLGYLLAFYPMLLILFSYVCIELYDRNFKPFVWIWKPFRACLIKFRHSWQPKTSIIDAFATFLILSYTKVTIITFSLLTSTQPHRVHHHSQTAHGGRVFYFDPQYNFFGEHHWPVGLLAVVVLIVFVVAPPVFLLLYPTRVFQECLNRSRCSRQSIHTFADAFQGCFKNRTNNNRDYRYFAGFYFVFRIIVLMIFVLDLPAIDQLLVQQILSILAVLVFALVKPYKEAFYNKVDLVFFTLLAIMNSLSFSNYTYSILNGALSPAMFAINYALAFLPLIYISAFLFYLFLKWKGVIPATPVVKELTAGTNDVNSTADETGSTVDIPDRLLNPQNYSSSNRPVHSVNSDATSEDERAGVGSKARPSQWVTEGSYFIQKARNMKTYSSM